MRYKNEWLNIIILFIDTHSKYTLLYIIVQGGPAGFDLQILLDHTVMILRNRASSVRGAHSWILRNRASSVRGAHSWILSNPIQ